MWGLFTAIQVLSCLDLDPPAMFIAFAAPHGSDVRHRHALLRRQHGRFSCLSRFGIDEERDPRHHRGAVDALQNPRHKLRHIGREEHGWHG